VSTFEQPRLPLGEISRDPWDTERVGILSAAHQCGRADALAGRPLDRSYGAHNAPFGLQDFLLDICYTEGYAAVSAEQGRLVR